jgi:hypothetical protein
MESPASEPPPPSPYVIGLAISIPSAVVGGWRVLELIELGFDARVAPEYPAWFYGFLWCLAIGPLLAGALGMAGSVQKRRAAVGHRLLLVAAGGLVVAWTLVQTWIRVVHDPDVAFGGLIWGVLHNLTLTRQPNVGATAAGSAGYSTGLVLGGVVWLALGVVLTVVGGSHPDMEDEPHRKENAG